MCGAQPRDKNATVGVQRQATLEPAIQLPAIHAGRFLDRVYWLALHEKLKRMHSLPHDLTRFCIQIGPCVSADVKMTPSPK
jgi:hypothetical protein